MFIIRGGKIFKYGTNSKQLTGENVPGELNNWDYLGTDPNEMLMMSYNILSQRSTTLYHTHPPVAAAINKMTSYGIGPGLIFRSQPDWQTLGITKERAKEWGMQFQKLLHYMFKMMNYYEKQSLLFRTALIMGDSLLFFDRNVEPGMPFDLIETGGDQIMWNATEQGVSTLGILHDKFLRRTGIVQFDEDRKEGLPVKFKDENGDQNVLQFYAKQMARQLRGYPLAYKIVSHAKNNSRLWDAVLARMVIEAMIIGNNSSEGNDFEQQAENLSAISLGQTSNSKEGMSELGNVTKSLPGTVFRTQRGIEFSDPKTPSNNFDKMEKAYIDLVGMSTDVPPECVMSSYPTSFTAHKGALNDFIRSYTQKRWGFSNNVNKPVVFEIAKYLILNGYIEMPHPEFFKNPIMREAALSGNWLGPVPGHINPKQEVDAETIAVQQGFKLRSDAAAMYGNEFDNMIEEYAQEEERWREATYDERAEKLAEDMDRQADDADDQDDQDDDADDKKGNGGDE